ncbi:MAG: flagellar motor switch protein FliN [Clostridia bacterium]|nr:flagellar motor switch protein FliN [Clostridia bacterium]
MNLTEEEIQKLLEAMKNGEDQPHIEKARFAPLKKVQVADRKINFDSLADVPLRIVAQLGRTRLTIKEILDLKEGSLITLDKLAGEPVELRIDGVLLAIGEVVVINDTFGVRINKLQNVKKEGQS